MWLIKEKLVRDLREQNTSDGFTTPAGSLGDKGKHEIKELGGLKGNKNGFSPVHPPPK